MEFCEKFGEILWENWWNLKEEIGEILRKYWWNFEKNYGKFLKKNDELLGENLIISSSFVKIWSISFFVFCSGDIQVHFLFVFFFKKVIAIFKLCVCARSIISSPLWFVTRDQICLPTALWLSFLLSTSALKSPIINTSYSFSSFNIFSESPKISLLILERLLVH